MGAQEQFILTLSENGYGKRTSSHEYRITGRGGKGIVAMAVNKRNGKLVASFPVAEDDQIMLISNGGQTIRLPVGGDKPIRIVSRGSQGVIVFDTAEGEKVVSVEHISEPEAEELPSAPEASVPPAPPTTRDDPEAPGTSDEPGDE
jgi:DNA gyrase subunit A